MCEFLSGLVLLRLVAPALQPGVVGSYPTQGAWMSRSWTSRSPICTPLGHHFWGVVELDLKIPELYCYKHSSEIKYSTLFRSGVFSFHHFVAIW
jgi:hypothetical protein